MEISDIYITADIFSWLLLYLVNIQEKKMMAFYLKISDIHNHKNNHLLPVTYTKVPQTYPIFCANITCLSS